MESSNDLKRNEKLLIDAFQAQNAEHYDVSLENLQMVGENIINTIDKIESSPDFYIRYMPLMKQERELVSEKDYKEFIDKNEKLLCRNFEKNAYLALLMQEMQEKSTKDEKRKMTEKQEERFRQMVSEGWVLADIHQRFSKYSQADVQSKYKQMVAEKESKSQPIQIEKN